MEKQTISKPLSYILIGALAFLTTSKLYKLYTNKQKKQNNQQKVKDNNTNEPQTEQQQQQNEQNVPQRKRAGSEALKSGQIFKIAITGGPCAGKATAIQLISDRLRERGLRVLNINDSLDLVQNGGFTANLSEVNTDQSIRFYSTLAAYVMNQEDRFLEFAQNDCSEYTTVILCDKGLMDIKACMKPETWQIILDENGWNQVELRDKRYDGIIHMLTTADGAIDNFHFMNNEGTLTVEEAKKQDRRIRDAWVAHPQFNLIDNADVNFDTKLEKTYQAVLKLIGLGEASTEFRKYLICPKNTKFDDQMLPFIPEDLEHEIITIEDTFLEGNEQDTLRSRLRKRGQKDLFFYQLVTKKKDKSTSEQYVHYEFKNQIQARDYLVLSERRDPTRNTLKKVRQTFFLDDQFCFIDTFTNTKNRFSVISVSGGKKPDELNLPESLKIGEDVTENKEYSALVLTKDHIIVE